MKLQYKIEIHRSPDDKKQNNRIFLRVLYRKSNYRQTPPKYEYCCPEIETAFYYEYITVVYDKRNFTHIKYDKRSEELKEPILCLRTYEEDFEFESGPVEKNLPISVCPFCTEKITFELVEKKKITHTCKKTSRTIEECEDQKEEEVIFPKKENKRQ